MSIDDGGSATEAETQRSPWYVRALMIMAAVMMCGMMVVTFVDVVGRYFFSRPMPGAFEYIGFLLALTIFSALPLVTRDGGHISVGLLDHLYRGRVRRLQQLVVLIITAVMVAFVTERMWSQGEYFREVDRIGDYLDIPLWPIVYATAFLSLVTFALVIGLIWRFIVRDGVDKDPA